MGSYDREISAFHLPHFFRIMNDSKNQWILSNKEVLKGFLESIEICITGQHVRTVLSSPRFDVVLV